MRTTATTNNGANNMLDFILTMLGISAALLVYGAAVNIAFSNPPHRRNCDCDEHPFG